MIVDKRKTQEQHGNVGDMIEAATQHFISGQLTLTESLCRDILAVDPKNSVAFHLLGIVAYQVTKFDVAEQFILKALAIDPHFTNAHASLGDTLKAQGRMEDAIFSYRKALDIEPRLLAVHFKLGITLLASGKDEDAASHIQQVIDIAPHNAQIYRDLGEELGNLGKMKDAEIYLRQAIAIKPDYAEAHARLAQTIKHTEYNDDIKKIENLYAKPETPTGSKILLAFSLGKSFEDFHQYDKAFYYYSLGNKLKRASFTYSIENDITFMNKIKETFTESLFKKPEMPIFTDITPIFILGMPRSGSTLAEQILSRHPNVHGAGELNYLVHTMNKYFKGYEDIIRADDKRLSEAGNEYLKMLKQYTSESQFITDKMPQNFLFIGMIKLILPQAKIIHCYRDPMDTCFSIYKNNFLGSHQYSNDLKELGQYYNVYHDLMEHWHRVLPGFILDLRYEDMVNEQEVKTRDLLEYCGLEWNDACLDFSKSDRKVTTSSFDQVRKPIYRSSIQSWKNYESQLGSLQEALDQCI